MQTSYSIDHAAGRLGGIADISMVQDIETYRNPAGEVKFGHVASRAANSDEIKHPAAAADVTDEKLVRGVVLASHEMQSKEDGGLPGYVTGSVVPVMRKGRIWVLSENTITEGTSTVNVYWAVSSPMLQAGSFRGASNSSFTAVLPKAKWKSSTTGAAQLAVLEIDL